ncbi:MAG: rRNA (adenine1518-N6/adenine1519-N6)-dimethyltransferase [Candidatus Cloacimonadota bacterium]|jgi:16S rRNA (adenine1518-N6/adenine1519-N6)-dimethyltransferase|nr:rRNA (adenine1518-N6/adenine1519-N6)-dimethyltransferase [Candidatus Cloacimonadota bacterium]
MSEFKQKKSLGQHFLTDKNIVAKIAKLAEIEKDEPVWEIGPGKGILTTELLAYNCQLTCFELDRTLFPILEEKFGKKINLVKQDILKADWQQYFAKQKLKIVANLPYQITSPFLFKVAQFSQQFSLVVVMIQKEVAKRIQAGAGSKDYGPLSLKMQYYFEPKYQFTVKPHVFVPPPKVDSAVISLKPRENRPELEDEKFFWRVVETAFGQRRKMLRRNLRQLTSQENLFKIQNNPIDLRRRGETLSEAEFIQLYKALKSL